MFNSPTLDGTSRARLQRAQVGPGSPCCDGRPQSAAPADGASISRNTGHRRRPRLPHGTGHVDAAVGPPAAQAVGTLFTTLVFVRPHTRYAHGDLRSL